MLNWYKKLYVGDNAKKKMKKTIWKVNHGAGVLDVYLVTLAVNPVNLLEIISANQLLQKSLRRRCPQIVGIAKGYEEAVEVVERIVMEVYNETGAVNVRRYLEQQVPE